MAAFEAPRAISQAEEVSTRNVQDHLRAESKIKRVLELFIYEKKRKNKDLGQKLDPGSDTTRGSEVSCTDFLR